MNDKDLLELFVETLVGASFVLIYFCLEDLIYPRDDKKNRPV